MTFEEIRKIAFYDAIRDVHNDCDCDKCRLPEWYKTEHCACANSGSCDDIVEEYYMDNARAYLKNKKGVNS